jgi:tetratricopeptide (TPR) repeat protein
VNQVQVKTNGHPLFVSQIFSLWEDTGLIASRRISPEKVVWEMTRQPEEIKELPPTLSALLEERIKHMSEKLQNILKHASVEGEVFSAQTITSLLKLDELQAIEDIETIENKYHLLEGLESKEIGTVIFDFYHFAHRFFREYVYTQLLTSPQRRILHRRVGECLEQLHTDHMPIAGLLARHFKEASIHLKAAGYALLAARLEQTRYAWTESESWCRFGLEMIEKLPEDDEVKPLRLNLLEQSGNGCYYSGDYRGSDRKYRHIIELAEQLNSDTEHIGSMYARMADICDERDEPEDGMRFVLKGKALLKKHDLPLGEVHLKLAGMEALLQCRFGNNELAIQLAQKVIADAGKLPQTSQLEHIRVDILSNLAIAYGEQNRYSESIATYKKAIEIAELIGDNFMLAICLSNMSDDYTYMGKLDEAESAVTRSLDISRQIGEESLRDQSLRYRARIFLQRGEPLKAIPDLQDATTVSEKAGLKYGIHRSHADLALAYLALSNLETAYHHATQGLVHAGDNDWWRSYAYYVLGQVETARGNWDQAVEHFECSIELDLGDDDRRSLASTQYHYAAALLEMGESEKANVLLKRALTTFQDLHLAYQVSEVQRLLDRAGDA